MAKSITSKKKASYKGESAQTVDRFKTNKIKSSKKDMEVTNNTKSCTASTKNCTASTKNTATDCATNCEGRGARKEHTKKMRGPLV